MNNYPHEIAATCEIVLLAIYLVTVKMTELTPARICTCFGNLNKFNSSNVELLSSAAVASIKITIKHHFIKADASLVSSSPPFESTICVAKHTEPVLRAYAHVYGA